MRKKRPGCSEIKNVILHHIHNNIKEYVILLIIFFIGLIFGVFFINNINREEQNEIICYINNFTDSIKENNSIDKSILLKKSIKQNLFSAFLLWFAGSTIIGMPIVYSIIGYRGFCLGYSISSLIATLELKSGIIFCISSMFLQNLILIPTFFILAVSGIKLYRSILKDNRRENIKIEIYRHTLLTLLMTVFLVTSSFIEAYISSNLISAFIKYI